MSRIGFVFAILGGLLTGCSQPSNDLPLTPDKVAGDPTVKTFHAEKDIYMAVGRGPLKIVGAKQQSDGELACYQTRLTTCGKAVDLDVRRQDELFKLKGNGQQLDSRLEVAPDFTICCGYLKGEGGDFSISVR